MARDDQWIVLSPLVDGTGVPVPPATSTVGVFLRDGRDEKDFGLFLTGYDVEGLMA